MKFKTKDKGMTLLEVVISITIGSILLGSMTLAFSHFMKNFQQIQHDIAIKKEIHFAINRIGDRIRQKGFTKESDSQKLVLKDGIVIAFKDAQLYFKGEPLFSEENVKVEEVLFTLSQEPNKQDLAQIKLRIQSKKIPKIEHFVQTSFSSRGY